MTQSFQTACKVGQLSTGLKLKWLFFHILCLIGTFKLCGYRLKGPVMSPQVCAMQ